MNYFRLAPIFTFVFLLQCSDNSAKESIPKDGENKNDTTTAMTDNKLDTITLGAGCFWCVEAIFDQLEGVEEVKSGYSGGLVDNPSYKEVCDGNTGHAEVCQISYNSSVIAMEDILEVFFQIHDPTTLNRQGADVGTQYRSVIFYHSENQKLIAERVRDELNKADIWPNPVATEITAFVSFYVAEDYQQQYFENNSDQPYCRAVIQPKVDKFQKVFKEKLRK